MSTIAISDIIIPENRQRRKFDQSKIEELAESIRTKGLLHPIVIRERCAEDGECLYTLVAGERRLRATQHLGHTTIPYTLIQDLDEYSIREAELEENVIREDLTWQERSNAYSELHKLRLEKNPKQTYKQTAVEVTDDTASPVKITDTATDVARSMLVSQFKDDPDVQRAKNLRDAAKVAERKIRLEFTAALAKSQKEKEGENEGPPHFLIHGKCELILRDIEKRPGYVPYTCTVVDPPYGMGADEFGDAALSAHSYQDDEIYAQEIMAYVLKGSYEKSAPEAHIYMFCDIDQFHWLRKVAANMGWKPWRTPLIWPKGGAGHIPWGPKFFRRNYECVFFATKGNKPLAELQGDIFNGFPPPQQREHAAQKPVELYRRFISLSCLPGDHVLDPCCGSGTIFTAAQATGTIATGIESSEESYKLAQAALMQTAQPGV